MITSRMQKMSFIEFIEDEIKVLFWHNNNDIINQIIPLLLYNRMNGKEFALTTVTEDFQHMAENALLITRNTANPEKLTGWTNLPDIEQFIMRATGSDISVYINTQTNKAAVYSADMSCSEQYTLLAVFPRLFPNYFKDKPLTDNEKELLNALFTDTHSVSLALHKISEEPEKIELKEAKVYNDFIQAFTDHRLTHYKEKVEVTRRDIANIERRLGELYTVLRQRRIEYLGAQQQCCAEPLVELRDYFKASRNLKFLHGDGSGISFVATGYIEDYDPDEYETVRENNYSYLQSEVERSMWAKEDALEFLDYLFLDRRAKIKTYAKIYLSNGNSPDGEEIDAYNLTYLPNSHITQFGCFGNGKANIMAAWESGNYVGAVSQCASQVKNINFCDSTVGEYFVRGLLGSQEPIIEFPDGEILTPSDAYSRMKKEDETNNG